VLGRATFVNRRGQRRPNDAQLSSSRIGASEACICCVIGVKVVGRNLPTATRASKAS
jgi:hypothetical protein